MSAQVRLRLLAPVPVTFACHLAEAPELHHARGTKPIVSCLVLVNRHVQHDQGEWANDDPTTHAHDSCGSGNPILGRGLEWTVSQPDRETMTRPKIVGDTQGLIKVIVDAETDQVLGATLLCIDSQEVINLVALAMRAGITATQLRDGIWTHPSATEAFNEVLSDLRSPS